MGQIITGIGEALWDMLPDGKKIGGAPANFAYHVSQFGLESCAVSAVGDDELGEEILSEFRKKGLNTILPKVDRPTGTVQVELDSAGVPQYEIMENVAWDNIPFTPRLDELASRTKAVCFGSLAQRAAVSRETINRFIDSIPAGNDPLIVFDINLRQHFYCKEVVDNSMKKCNVLKINDEELETVAAMFDIPAADIDGRCAFLLEKYALRILILTCGVKGSYVFTPDGVSFLETPSVKVADTVGAGDSFTAAFVSSIVKGKSPAEAHRIAVGVSAFVCTQNGAMPVLPEEYVG